tara:strand:- start:1354 stop:2049 length:696 start_codon:yes stop_codon:yes gene_type:complete
MNFIKKIFERQVDDSVHLQFQKFSKGEFRNRAVIKAKQSKGKYSITTTAEFANELVKNLAGKLGEEKTNIIGVIVSTNDLTGELDFQGKKQFQGVKQYIIDKEMSGNDITKLFERFPKAFFALSFSAEESVLKIKAKAPKSGKPGKGNEKPKPDFCRLKTTNRELGQSFVFEKPDFKNAEIIHNFIIEKIIFPEEEKDFAKIREMAKRKGKIIREAEIDGEKIVKEVEFEV